MLKKFYANSSAAILIIFAVVVCGLIEFTRLPVALYPMTSKPVVVVRMYIPDMAPQEYYSRYGDNTEEILRQVENVVKVNSEYKDDSAEYQVTFDWGVKPEEAKGDVMRSLASVESSFPRHWGHFRYWFKGGEGAMTIASVTSDELTPQELSELLNDSLVPRLRAIEEFSSIWIKRFDQKKIEIIFYPDRLMASGVTPDEVGQALRANEYNSSLGSVDFKTGESRQVILAEKSRSLADVKQTLVGIKNGRRIFLSDVADVRIEEVLPDEFFKANGKNGLIIVGSTKPDANIANASKQFYQISKKTLADLGIKADLDMVLDPSVFINNAVDNVVMAVVMGVLVAGLVIFFFLGSLKNTIIIGLAIPFSLIGGFILMAFLGIELNLISLGAMALAAGLVVDGSVVVIENICRHYEISRPKTFQDQLTMVTNAVYEVANSVIASMLTSIIVFAPLSFTSPLASAILGDLAKVIVCVSLVSIIATLVITPPIVMWLGPGPSDSALERRFAHFTRRFTQFVDRSKLEYIKILSKLLSPERQKTRRWFVAGTVASFALSLVLMGFFVKREIMGLPETDKVFLGLHYKTGDLELKQSEKIVDYYESEIRNGFGSGIDKTLSQIRKSGGWVLNFIKDKSEIETFRKNLEDKFKNTPLIDFWVYPWTPTSLEIPQPALVSVDVISGTINRRMETLETLQNLVGQVDGIGQMVVVPYPKKSDQYEVQFKENRLASAASTETAGKEAVLSHVSQALRKIEIKDVTIDDKTIPVELSYPEYFIQNADDIKNMIVRQNEKFIPARNYIVVNSARKRDRFAREDGHRVYRLEVWPAMTKIKESKRLTDEIMSKIKEDKSINMGSLRFNNTEREINENIASLIDALFIALFLVVIVICVQFGSFTQTLCIVLAVPLGIIGVGFSLFIFQSVLSVNSMLGIILLSGTAVNNSIIFVDFFNHLRAQAPHRDIVDVLLDTARLRFRPIMITTMTTILGMLPIAIGFGEGGEILKPLGIAACGGLGISTLLTLFIVPLALHRFSQTKWDISRTVTPTLATLIVVGLWSWSPLAQAEDIKIAVKRFEKAGLERYVGVELSRFETDIAKTRFRAALGEFLPKLDVGYQVDMLKQEPIYDDLEKRNEYSFLTVEYNLSALFSRASVARAAKFDVQKAEKSLQVTLLEVQAEIRKAFYSVWKAQSQLSNTKESLTLAERYEKNSLRRYKSGLIHRNDAERGRLLRIRLEVALVDAQKELASQQEKLQYLTGLTWSVQDAKNVRDGLVIGEFGYFKENMDDLNKKILAAKTPQIEMFELAESASRTRQAGAVSDTFLPHLYSQFSYQKSESAQPSDNTSLSFGVKWSLFNGGKDYQTYRQRVTERHISKAQKDDAYERRQRDVRMAIGELNYLKKALETQSEVVRSWREIVAGSQKRFESGMVKAIEVDDDFKSYLDELALQYDMQLKTIHQIADLAVLSGDGSLFETLF